MKKIVFLASIITVLISCQAPKQKETAQIDEKIVIGHEFNDKSEKLDIISGDVGLTSIWLDYMKAHNERDLDKISTFTNHAKVMESPVAILCDFELMKDDT